MCGWNTKACKQDVGPEITLQSTMSAEVLLVPMLLHHTWLQVTAIACSLIRFFRTELAPSPDHLHALCHAWQW